MTELFQFAWLFSVWVMWTSYLLTGIYLSCAFFNNSIDFLNSRAAFLVPAFFFFFMFEIVAIFPGRLEWFYFSILLVAVAVIIISVLIAMYLTRRIWEFIAFAVRLLM